MNIKLSIEFQKRVNTYDRNQAIKMLAKAGMNYAEIGRWYKRSRERIRQIVDREDEELKNPSWWRRFWSF